MRISVDNKVLVGLLLALSSAQFLTLLMLCEGIAPDYSMHDNAISDLGTIDETRLLFNSSLFAIGLLNVLTGYFFYKVHGDRILLLVFAVAGIGAMGAGLIPLDSKIGIHGLFALFAFLFMNAQAILSGRLVKNPLRLMSTIAGILGIVFTVVMILVDSETIDVSGSIGHGAVERLIAYPALIWMILYGGYMLSSPELGKAKRAPQGG